MSLLLGIGASLLGGLFQSRGASRAASAQTDAANAQIASNERICDIQNQNLAPFREAGGNALAHLTNQLDGYQPSDAYDRLYGTGPYQQSDRYRFLAQEAQRGIDGSAAARGQLFSSATLDDQARTRFGLAAMDYDNWLGGQERRIAFNQGQQDNYLNRLTGIVGMGQAAAAGQATAASNLGMQNNNALANLGDARAAGAIGQANALNGTIGNALNTWGYMSQMQGR